MLTWGSSSSPEGPRPKSLDIGYLDPLGKALKGGGAPVPQRRPKQPPRKLNCGNLSAPKIFMARFKGTCPVQVQNSDVWMYVHIVELIHIHIHIDLMICIYIYICIYTCCMYLSTYTCICVLSLSLYIYICIFMCVYI